MKVRIDELTRKDLLSDVEKKVIRRSANLKLPQYLGITDDYIIYMRVESSTGQGSYIVKIKLEEYPDIANEADMTTKEKVRIALAGNIGIYCSCPAFRYYGYEYITTQVGVNSGSVQNIYPKIRNPQLVGIMCKHCYPAFKRFGSYWNRIAKDIDTHNFIRGDIS